ncbi:hypothetical protein SALBM311S_01050 [Streptomyces alboniger]
MSSMTKIEPLGAVRERVLATLRQEIIAGRLGSGDRLVERELAERFGVSRVPVREAIRALVAEGFVHFETPRRTVVRRLTRNDVKETSRTPCSSRPSSAETEVGCEASPTSYSASYSTSPERSPVNIRPVRLPPCAAGARPTISIRAFGGPKPGTGRPQYVQSAKAAP